MRIWDPTSRLLSDYGKHLSLTSLFYTEMKFWCSHSYYVERGMLSLKIRHKISVKVGAEMIFDFFFNLNS